MTRILSISAAALVLALAAGVPVANASVAPVHIAAELGDRSAGVSQEEGSNVQAKIKICLTTSCAFKPKPPRKKCFRRVDNRTPRNRVDNRTPRNRVDNRTPRNRVDNRTPRNRVDRRRCT